MDWLAENLPHATASLNAVATVLLIAGGMAVRQRKYRMHRNLMLTCFAVSATFLALYLLHKVALYQTTGSPNKRFPTDVEPAVRTIYLSILGTHLVLAIAVVPMILTSIWHAMNARLSAHRRIARITMPIWLYVSVTGVVVYWMLYHAYAQPTLPA